MADTKNQKVLQWVNGTLLDSYEDPDDDEPLSIIRKRNAKTAPSSNYKDFDSSLAKQLNQLSIDERGRMFEHIHGVAPRIEETPEFIDSKLQDLHCQLGRMTPKPQAYFLAIRQNEGYVMSKSFGLMFLRSELFDVPKALTRLLLFLEKKLEYFGPDALTRSLRLSDLSEGAQSTLENGSFQLLPFRDQSGRLIFVEAIFTGDRGFPHVSCYFYVKSFICIAAVENDEMAQRLGCIDILWNMDYLRLDMDADAYWTREAYLIAQWLPLRVNAVHVCNDMDPIKQFWARFIIAITPPELRNSFRLHQGTPTEVLFALMTYGIPVNLLPVDKDGRLTKSNSIWWSKVFKATDSLVRQGEPCHNFAVPSNKDVLFGRGDPIQKHPGNQNFRRVLLETFLSYQGMSRKEKTAHTWRIVDTVLANGGRFLRKHEAGWWIEVTRHDARQKVSNTYADIKGKDMKKGGVKNLNISVTVGDSKRIRVQDNSSSLLSRPLPSDRESNCFQSFFS